MLKLSLAKTREYRHRQVTSASWLRRIWRSSGIQEPHFVPARSLDRSTGWHHARLLPASQLVGDIVILG
jgi:hypothetical protein